MHKYLKLRLTLILILATHTVFAVAMAGAPKSGPQHVVMVSIDGYRFDYTEMYRPPHIIEFAAAGVRAQGLVPVYPSLTFPNHYTLVTGQRVEKHGIVSNDFYDPQRDASYHLFDSDAVRDGSWYGGSPLWVWAKKHGLKTASFFWVGSEAEIGGVRPDYYKIYDPAVPGEERVEQVLEWLSLPEAERPRFITLYFSRVDSFGHRFGPESEQVKAAVHQVDGFLGKLFQGVEKLSFPVNVIIVSDHGMQSLDAEKILYLEDYVDLEGVTVMGKGAHTLLYIKEPKKVASFKTKLSQVKHLVVREPKDFPQEYGHTNNQRLGQLVLTAQAPYYIMIHRALDNKVLKGATHGFDPRTTPSMKGIFYAKGPAIKSNVDIAPFENVHVYPFVLKLLDIEQNPNIDGKLSVLSPLLKEK